MDEFIPPEGKPLWLSKEEAQALPYPGADVAPLFDHEIMELSELPPLTGDGGEAAPARGKGPSRGYITRWSEIARLHSLGYTNNQIGRHLGYSPAGISLALQHEYTQTEIARWRETLASQSAIDRVKSAAPDAVSYMSKVVADERQKTSDRMTAAQWIAEKALGKARQEHNVESGTLNAFMDLMRDMRTHGEPVDVTPRILEARAEPSPQSAKTNGVTKQTSEDELDTWITANL